MLSAPLEQFQILSILSIRFLNFDFSISNFFIMSLLSIGTLCAFLYLSSSNNSYLQCFFYFSSNSWQKILEMISEIKYQLISDIILTDKEKYFPLISVLFTFILFSNLMGLIPYTFTITSHLFVTLMLSFSVFIGTNIITLEKYKIKFFSLFLPTNTTFFLALLLVPIEFVSYIAKPISLSVRLFINLMAGHTLLKVIVGFSWSMTLLENFISLGFVPLIMTLVALFGMELGVALIQTYVFIVLTCIYIQDAS